MLDGWVIWAVVLLALAFDYINGFHDTANAIATSVSTRAIAPKMAVMMAATLNFLGAMISTGVAKTIGGDIVTAPEMINGEIIVAALVGAIFWNLLTWWYGIPSSSSHALIGGIIGAVLISVGPEALQAGGIGKIFISLVASPILALVLGYIVMKLLLILFVRKAMGIITLTLVASGHLQTLDVPIWVKIACATAMALGTAAGGWKIIATVGSKIFKLESINGFAADLNSAITIFAATLLHLPVSTTHVVSGSIMGVGTAMRVRAVNWSTARSMVFAWFITIPLSAGVSALAYVIIDALAHV